MKTNVLALAFLFGVVLFGENVSVGLLSREFRNGVYTIDGPENIAAHVPTTDFIIGFANITGQLYTNLMLEYYRQARLTGTIVGSYFIGSVDALLNRARESPEGTSTYLDDSIKDVNDGLMKFLITKPGPSETADDVKLPELPAQAGPIIIHYENYEPEVLFNELEKLVDQDMASIYNLTQKIYRLGWRKARLSLKTLQQQFRDQFLHGILLKTFVNETKRIDESSALVRNHVEPQSWSTYKELSARLHVIAETVALTHQEFSETDIPQN